MIEESDKKTRNEFKEILNKYAEYIIPEIWANFNTRSGRVITTYTPVEELRNSESYEELKEEFNSLDKLPKSFLNKLYSLGSDLEEEDIEEYKNNFESFRTYIGEFGGYLFASKDSFNDWLYNLERKLRKNSPEEQDRDRKYKEAKERVIKNAKFKEGDLVKFDGKIFKIKQVGMDYNVEDDDFENVTVEYDIAYPESGKAYRYGVKEEDLEFVENSSIKMSSNARRRLVKLASKIKNMK